MRAKRLHVFFAGILMAGLVCPLSPAQDRASDHSPSVPVLDPPSMDKPPVADGIVDRYLLNPRGEVNGLLLRDGSQMHVTLRAAQAEQAADHREDLLCVRHG